MPTRHLLAISIVAAAPFLAAALPAVSRAQTYDLTTLLDQNSPRPDGMGNFNVAWTVPPAFSGSAIAFIDYGSTTQEYWVIDPDTKALKKLVDTNTKAPGGVGNFSSFVPPNNNVGGLAPRIGNGVLYFWATDQTSGGNANSAYGLYSVKLTGGSPHEIVNHKTLNPDGGTIAFIQSFVASGNRVLFNAGGAVFETTGGKPVVVTDGNTQIRIAGTQSYYGCYNGVAIDGVNVAVTASNCFDPSRGLNVIFVGPYDNFASVDKLPVVGSYQTLPGDTDASPHLDVISDAIFLSGNLLYFGGIDTFSTASAGFYGYYYAPFGVAGAPAAASGSPIYKIFDNQTSGLSGSFGSFGSASFDQGTLAFVATANSNNTGGIYVANGPQPVLLTTDLQRGVATPLGISDGRVAFGGAGFFDSQLDLVAAASCGVTDVSGVKITKGKITPGASAGEYQQVVTLTNMGADISGTIDLELTKLTTGVSLLNATGVTGCTSPAGAPYITASTIGLGQGAAVTVTLDVWSPAKGSFGYTAVTLTGSGTP